MAPRFSIPIYAAPWSWRTTAPLTLAAAVAAARSAAQAEPLAQSHALTAAAAALRGDADATAIGQLHALAAATAIGRGAGVAARLPGGGLGPSCRPSLRDVSPRLALIDVAPRLGLGTICDQ